MPEPTSTYSPNHAWPRIADAFLAWDRACASVNWEALEPLLDTTYSSGYAFLKMAVDDLERAYREIRAASVAVADLLAMARPEWADEDWDDPAWNLVDLPRIDAHGKRAADSENWPVGGDPEDDWHDEDDRIVGWEDDDRPVRVNTFGQRLRDDAEPLPGDHYA